MPVVVRMPALAAGATEAAVQTWLVDVGDPVRVGQPIAEIETEKAVVEFEADAAGTVAELLVAAGAAAAVGAPIAVLAAEGESAEDAVRAAGVATTGAATPDASTPDAAPTDAAPTDAEKPAAPATPEVSAPKGGPAEVQSGSAPAVTRERIFASPLVRRLAKERGIALESLQGSGPGGRIVRRDLDALPAASAPRSAPAPASADAAPYTDTPHTPMRRAIARRLTESVTTIPQFTVTAHARVDRLLALRAEINEGRTERISLNDLVLKAVGAALTDVPEANAVWTDDAVRRFAHADIGVAVALDGGLVTPVVRGVDRLPLGDLSTRVREASERARAGRLRQGELEGGSFAVSNLGMLGVSEFTAIINPPHSGILAVGAAERRAVVADDGAITVATLLTLTLTGDHRVLDGALAARLLAAIVARLESPVGMLV